MNLTLNELLEGKATIIKNKDYLPTKDYVSPFLDEMSKITNDFRVKVKLPDQITVGASQDLTYNRVLIEAVLPKEFTIDNHDEVIGFIYGLDVRKPIAKLYRGHLNQACTNLTVFSPTWMLTQEIKPAESFKFKVNSLLDKPNDFKTNLDKLKTTFITRSNLNANLGNWIERSLRDSYYNGVQNVRLSPSVPVEAYKSLFVDESSEQFISGSKEPSLFEIYNAFTQIITDDDKDIMNGFEKTMMVNKLLNV